MINIIKIAFVCIAVFLMGLFMTAVFCGAEAWNHETLCEMAAAGHQVEGEYECRTAYVGSNAFIQILEEREDGKIMEHYSIYKESI